MYFWLDFMNSGLSIEEASVRCWPLPEYFSNYLTLSGSLDREGGMILSFFVGAYMYLL